jgi:hypothetical protein
MVNFEASDPNDQWRLVQAQFYDGAGVRLGWDPEAARDTGYRDPETLDTAKIIASQRTRKIDVSYAEDDQAAQPTAQDLAEHEAVEAAHRVIAEDQVADEAAPESGRGTTAGEVHGPKTRKTIRLYGRAAEHADQGPPGHEDWRPERTPV